MSCSANGIDPADHMGLVWTVASWFVGADVQVDETEEFSDACLSLVKAAKNFKPELGFQFSTYAMTAMKREVARQRGRRWMKAARQYSVDSFEFTDAVGVHHEFEQIEDDELSELVQRVAGNLLNAREWKVVQRRMNGETLEVISSDFGVTRERVRQIQDRALNKLRAFLAPLSRRIAA